MTKRVRSWIATTGTLAAALTLNIAPPLHAQGTPTEIVVRAVAHDAKIIGSGVGGARITIRDVATGRVLAEGVQEGSTGDTNAIMRTPRERGATVFDTPGAAAFRATLTLERPTQVEIVAEGPLGTEHALQRASRTVLVVPGEDIVGEGVSLVLNGFTVVIESPDAGTVEAGGEVRVQANVTMLCGCPTEPGGLWDANDIRITARFVRDGQVLGTTVLEYAGTTSTYAGTLQAPGSGEAELQVLAVDRSKANAGMATRTVRVR